MRKPHLLAHLRSTRVRAALGLGVVVALGTTGTFAFWTDSVAVSGTTFTSGRLDLQVDNADSVANASGTLSMTNMAPGSTSAQILTVKNNGNIPLKWTLAGLLTGGADDAAFSSAAAISLTIRTGATVSGSGNTATCSGGTVLAGPSTLTTTSAALVATPQPTTAGSGLGAAATVPLCFQVTFSAAAPTTLQSKTTKATFTFSGTSDLS
ncbi:putative ribosomally synthesized peptide with SipW-like signal peptide [Marmoricola sp. URHA0025 HA25]